MGGFLGNTFLRSDSQSAVVEGLGKGFQRYFGMPRREPVPLGDAHDAAFGRLLDLVSPSSDSALQETHPVAYVSPVFNGWVGVFDSVLEGAVDLLNDVSVALSGHLRTVAISFQIYDGDVFRYCLAKEGRILDQFDSMPGYLGGTVSRMERQALKGNPELLAETCGKPESGPLIAKLLRSRKKTPHEQLSELANLFGIENALLSFGDFWTQSGFAKRERYAEFVAVSWQALKS